jgi:hypothetical protein
MRRDELTMPRGLSAPPECATLVPADDRRIEMADETTPAEQVLIESDGGYFKGKMRMIPGRLELTPTRIIYYKRSFWAQSFGFIGALLANKMGKRDTDIEFAGIASIARGKYALNKKILDIAMTDGSAHRISVNKFDEFVQKLTDTTGKAVAPLAE